MVDVCTVEGCENPLNRDGLCFAHKIGTLRWNGGYRLKKEREGGYCQQDLRRDILEGARHREKEGHETRAVGRRRPTEVQRGGEWVRP